MSLLGNNCSVMYLGLFFFKPRLNTKYCYKFGIRFGYFLDKTMYKNQRIRNFLYLKKCWINVYKFWFYP